MMIGKVTRGERREKVQRYLEKKKRRNWKAIRYVCFSNNFVRYEVRKDLAEKRLRFHGRFVKNNKKSITELAKAYQVESMTNSGMSSEINSRKDSVTNLITPMKNLNLSPDKFSLAENENSSRYSD